MPLAFASDVFVSVAADSFPVSCAVLCPTQPTTKSKVTLQWDKIRFIVVGLPREDLAELKSLPTAEPAAISKTRGTSKWKPHGTIIWRKPGSQMRG